MASRIRTTIRYDGPALAGHEIDVQELAPALLALADIVHLANKRFNGEAASMKVMVSADVEQRCFQIDLHLVQTLFDQAKGLFTEENIKTAKEIAAAIGLVATTGGTLFKLIKFFGKKTENPTTEFKIKAGRRSTVIVINGDGNTITVPQDVYDLATTPDVMAKAKAVLSPLERPGYEELSFVQDDKPTVTLTKDEAVRIADAPPLEGGQEPQDSPSNIRGPVRIKSPQYEGSAKWTVLWGGRPIDVAMPSDWLNAFQANQIEAPPNSILDVDMVQTVRLAPDGTAVGNPTYVIQAVNGVVLPVKRGHQLDWVAPLQEARPIRVYEPTAPRVIRTPRRLGHRGKSDPKD